MRIYIKHMVSHRCILVVKYNLEQIGIEFSHVHLGFIESVNRVTKSKLELLRDRLAFSGLIVIDDEDEILVERVKISVRHYVHHNGKCRRTKLSEFLKKSLEINYSLLSRLFSRSEGITIEQFYILHRIEKVKELLVYGESLSEIAYRLNYSSVAYLCSQFKKVTGMTPSKFKSSNGRMRKTLETL
ncbi:MAG: helix-turn-helix domain-containing protein [Rikenellaceae bacterium]|nr:helix-turn-helix domain-containing protein [Rikenellaceae bacterium]